MGQGASDQREQAVRYYLQILERSKAYTTGVLAVAYASSFGVWAFARSTLAPRQYALAGLLLLVSVASFALWEVYSMWIMSQSLLDMARAVTQGQVSAVEGLQRVQTEQRQRDLKPLAWTVFFWTSVSTAITAFAVMAWGLVETLWTGLFY